MDITLISFVIPLGAVLAVVVLVVALVRRRR